MSTVSQPAISVLMTVFNTPFELVRRAIDSVLNQDCQSFELLVIDDGSKEELSEQVIGYCQIHQSKIRYVKHQNCGQSQSVNRGVQLSVGTYIAFIDSDDEYRLNHLSACLSEMKYVDLISSFTETIVTCEADHFVPDRFDHKKSIHVDDCTLFATLFGRREVFETLRFKTMYSADSEFYNRASLDFIARKVNLRTYIYYRNNSHSITAQLKENQLILF